MLTIIGLFPATYALNPESGQSLKDVAALMQRAQPLIQKYGDDEKIGALAAASEMEQQAASPSTNPAGGADEPAARQPLELGRASPSAKTRANVRDRVYRVISQLEHAESAKGASHDEKAQAK